MKALNDLSNPRLDLCPVGHEPLQVRAQGNPVMLADGRLHLLGKLDRLALPL